MPTRRNWIVYQGKTHAISLTFAATENLGTDASKFRFRVRKSRAANEVGVIATPNLIFVDPVVTVDNTLKIVTATLTPIVTATLIPNCTLDQLPTRKAKDESGNLLLDADGNKINEVDEPTLRASSLEELTALGITPYAFEFEWESATRGTLNPLWGAVIVPSETNQ